MTLLQLSQGNETSLQTQEFYSEIIQRKEK